MNYTVTVNGCEYNGETTSYSPVTAVSIKAANKAEVFVLSPRRKWNGVFVTLDHRSWKAVVFCYHPEENTCHEPTPTEARRLLPQVLPILRAIAAKDKDVDRVLTKLEPKRGMVPHA